MRSSAHRSDPGFKNFNPGATITVDGEAVKKCFTADEELGEAWCYRVNEAGMVYRDGKDIAKICHRGKVVIIPPSSSSRG